MAEPIITKIEVHEYEFTLNDLGTDYNGFNFVYVPVMYLDKINLIFRAKMFNYLFDILN